MMKTLKDIIRKSSFLFFGLVLSAWYHEAMAQHQGEFPFFRSFLDGNQTGIAKPANSNNNARLTNDGMLLTDNKNQLGAFYLNNHTFSSNEGVVIEFEYIMMRTSTREPLDGICMVLFDANESAMTVGAKGAGLGYTYNRSITRWAPDFETIGIKGAYLGIGLDNGMFKNRRFQGEEIRTGLFYDGDIGQGQTSDMHPAAHSVSSNVTLRGAAGTENRYIGIRTEPAYRWGYPVLVTRHTKSNDIGYILKNDDGFFRNNTNDANFSQISHPFDIQSGGIFTSPKEDAYRKATIKLEPNPDTVEGGFMITVKIQHGEYDEVVINKYIYPKRTTYRENAIPEKYELYGSDPNYKHDLTDSQRRITYETPPPAKFKIGFTAATGLNDYINIIKNLRISVADAANTTDDYYYSHRRGPVTTRPLDNDVALKEKNGTTSDWKAEYVDPTSFRFWKDENNLSANPYECTIASQGTWVYDPGSQEALFFPVNGFKGETFIRYDVKGKFNPYDDELYRSSQTNIVVVIDDNQPNKTRKDVGRP